jgi:hypothetical protein
MSEPTLEEMIECARREVRMRRRVYPRWVADGRMTQAAADREIASMEAIADRLCGQAATMAALVRATDAAKAVGGRLL